MTRWNHFGRLLTLGLSLQLGAGALLAGIPTGYYDSADDSSASALRSSLNNIITSGHNNVGYSNSWEPSKRIWEDTGNTNNCIMIYTGDSRPKADQDTGSGSNGVALTGDWNREHIFPQSEFSQDEPMRSDLHALFPCDSDVNNARSNQAFGEVATNTNTMLNGTGCLDDNTLFEPRSADKGDVARALFYMDVRYEGETTEPNMQLTDQTENTVTADGIIGDFTTLLQWHIDDPVDAFEESRNDQVYVEQGNRNPFIDHPEWVAILYNQAAPTDGDAATVTSIDRAGALAAAGTTAPMVTVVVQASTNEWDAGGMTVAQLGTISDSEITAIRVYKDTNQDGDVDGGESLLGSGTLTSG
ncbi:endonuclease, partial [Candidatus Poribacteria bacterium]|nr:endonuclease [Candidatus Poribacteria bacterium]